MPRLRPYSNNRVTWGVILEKSIEIPMNQREYSWTVTEIKPFIDDIIMLFDEKKYVGKMGTIINYNGASTNAIYDGQQRLITITLIMYSIAIITNCLELKNKIYSLLRLNSMIDDLNKNQQKLIEKYNNINNLQIPKLYCVNYNDMHAIVTIYNDISVNQQTKNNNNKFECNICKTIINTTKQLETHFKNQHKSNIYPAYDYIRNYIKNKKYKDKLINLYKFIIKSIDIDFCECSDPLYVSRIFDWENNRGQGVDILDIAKNNILVMIDDEKKLEIYDKWENYKKLEHTVYKKKYGDLLFNVAIQIYNGKISRTPDIIQLYNKIIKQSGKTYDEILRFFRIIEKLDTIMKEIGNNKWGKIIMKKNKKKLAWETYMFSLLPIFFCKNSVDNNLLLLIVKWYVRNLPFKTRSFNSLGYSNEFIRITNECLNNPEYNYYNDIFNCLVKNVDTQINTRNYARNLREINIYKNGGTNILLFLETYISTDINTVAMGGNVTIEHIIPQANERELEDYSNMNKLGNLTLLEKNNSANKHKGNSSLGKKEYIEKKDSYSNSNFCITRKIPNKFSTFTEKDITKRTKKLAKKLDKYTRYFEK